MKSSNEKRPSWRERLYPERLPNEEFDLWLGGPVATILLVIVAMYLTGSEGPVSGVLILGCALFFTVRAGDRRLAKLNAKIEELEAELKAPRLTVLN